MNCYSRSADGWSKIPVSDFLVQCLFIFLIVGIPGGPIVRT